MRTATPGWRQGPVGTGLKELGCVLPVAWYPVLFVYSHNAAEASLSQIWLSLGLFTAAAAFFFLLFAAAARNAVAGGLAAMAAMALTAFWRPAEEIARNLWWSLRYWHLVPLALAGCWALAVALPKAERRWSLPLARARTVLCVLFSLLVVYNFVLAAPALWDKMRTATFRDKAAEPVPMQAAAQEDLPNVYLIILDEYAPFAMAEKYYGYYPVEFEAFLKMHRFNISTNSHNSSFYTQEVTAGLIGLEPPEEITKYTLTTDGRFGKFVTGSSDQNAVYAKSKLMYFFKSRGYTVKVATMLGEVFNMDTPRLYCDEYFQLPLNQRGKSWENTVTSTVLERSALEPIQYMLHAHVDVNYYNRMVEGIFNWIQKSVQNTPPRFLWAHVICPHGPYLFESDGRWRQEPGSEADPQNYLKQYQYITMRITEVLTTLIAKNPNIVIMLMSDHSARQKYTLPVVDMSHIFNVVYYRGELLDVEGLSGLDTELLVLNRLFGTSFPIVRGPRTLAGVVP